MDHAMPMPSSTLVAAAQAAPPLGRRQLPVFRSLELPPRDWAGLPPELLSCILHRLDHVQIMLGADKVCRSWRRAARDEPELWRLIDMRGYEALSNRNLVDLNQMAVEAVRRSQGQCQAFTGEGNGLHDDFILFLGNRAPLLKRLILLSCHQISGQGFIQTIKGFPLLEELHLSKCSDVQHLGVFEAIAKECPRLKYLRICYGPYVTDGEAMAIARMQELHSLQLTGSHLSNQGLAAILDNCLHIKSLDIIDCNNIHMTPEVQARIKTKKLLMNYSLCRRWDNDFDERDSPTDECSICSDYFRPNREWYRKRYPRDKEEAMVISAVSALRSLELYRNDLTSKGLTTVLDTCPRLEPLDVWNCLNISVNNDALLRANKWQRHWIKTKKPTIKLLMDRSNYKHHMFNPEALDIRTCRDIVMNSYNGRRIIMDNTLGAKYKRLKIRKMARKYHQMTKKMKARIEDEYMAKRPRGNVDYMEFEEGAVFSTSGYYYDIVFDLDRFEPNYQYNYNYYQKRDREFEPGRPIISECSTCLMFEYLAERWRVFDIEDYSDYYESSYGLDAYNEIEFQVHDRMLAKRFRRYLKIQ